MPIDLRQIAAGLREARRYVRSDPGEAGRLVANANADILAAKDDADSELLARTLDRLLRNLAVGSKFAVVEPDVFAGYIDGAAFELDVLAGPIEVKEVSDAVV